MSTEYDDHWTAIGHPDLRIVRFLAVDEADRIVIAQVRTELDLHFLAVVPFRMLVKLSPSGKIVPWGIDEVADLAACHIDRDRISIER